MVAGRLPIALHQSKLISIMLFKNDTDLKQIIMSLKWTAIGAQSTMQGRIMSGGVVLLPLVVL